ncbi:MAG: hypothetical protein WAN46_21490, partial [Gammaproteobacteria bacterium]
MKKFAAAKGSGLLGVAVVSLFYMSDAVCLDAQSGSPAILSAMTPAAYQRVDSKTLGQIRGSALDPLVLPSAVADTVPPLAGAEPPPVAEPTPVVAEPPAPEPVVAEEPVAEPTPVVAEPPAPEPVVAEEPVAEPTP